MFIEWRRNKKCLTKLFVRLEIWRTFFDIFLSDKDILANIFKEGSQSTFLNVNLSQSNNEAKPTILITSIQNTWLRFLISWFPDLCQHHTACELISLVNYLAKYIRPLKYQNVKRFSFMITRFIDVRNVQNNKDLWTVTEWLMGLSLQDWKVESSLCEAFGGENCLSLLIPHRLLCRCFTRKTGHTLIDNSSLELKMPSWVNIESIK